MKLIICLLFGICCFAQQAKVYVVPEVEAAQGAKLYKEMVTAQEKFVKWKDAEANKINKANKDNAGAYDFTDDFKYAIPAWATYGTPMSNSCCLVNGLGTITTPFVNSPAIVR